MLLCRSSVSLRSSLLAGVVFAILAGVALVANAAAALPGEDFEQLYYDEGDDRYVKDHTLIKDGDTFHLFYVAGNAGEGWDLPGNEVEFGHATSTDLEHWQLLAPVLPIDPAHGWKARNVWAPHVVRAGLEVGGQPWTFVMAYAGVDSSFNQQIGIAVSDDLLAWTDLSVLTGAYHPDPLWAQWDVLAGWSACRDPFLFEWNGSFQLLATALTRDGYLGQGTRGAIAHGAAADGVEWSDAGAPLVTNDHWSVMSSPQLAQNPVAGTWHLFYTRTVAPGGVHYLSSSAPTSGWDIATDQLFDALSIASEITEDGGVSIYSHVEDLSNAAGEAMTAVRFDTLSWVPPAGVPVVERRNALFAHWSLVEGDLGAQPTFGDRPGFRSGVASNVEGRFWVNTAENDAGLYGSGCATCGPDEAQTGVLRSETFQVSRANLELWVGGTNSPDCYVALVDAASGTALRSAHGADTDVMEPRSWAVADLVALDLYLEIVDHDASGHVSVDAIVESGATLAIAGPEPAAAAGARPPCFLRAAPNPAGGAVRLAYGLEATAAVPVRIRVYDARGRLQRSLAAAGATGAAGPQALAWDGRLESGERAPAGTYFLRLESGAGRLATTRVTLVR